MLTFIGYTSKRQDAQRHTGKSSWQVFHSQPHCSWGHKVSRNPDTREWWCGLLQLCPHPSNPPYVMLLHMTPVCFVSGRFCTREWNIRWVSYQQADELVASSPPSSSSIEASEGCSSVDNSHSSLHRRDYLLCQLLDDTAMRRELITSRGWLLVPAEELLKPNRRSSTLYECRSGGAPSKVALQSV